MGRVMKKFAKKLLSLSIVATLVILAIPNVFTASAFSVTGNGVVAASVSENNAFDVQALTYTRVVCLKHSGSYNGTLLSTFDQHSWVNGQQVWPIYKSTDDGTTWTHVTDVRDSTFGTDRKAEPMIYELPQAVGNMSAGTLLLAGNLVPDDQSSTRIVVYESTDHGSTWTYLSTVDTGGPAVYDRSTTSTTTAVWEPFLYLDSQGRLVCAFSDERQKADGVLQALAFRYTSDGTIWSSLQNMVAVDNDNDRPGMVTVSKLPNGEYIAAYEVVNKPSYNQNSSVVYYKFSSDGDTWNPGDIGTYLTATDGGHLGSSPYVKWVNAGGPNGMIIIGSKWTVDSSGDIEAGGQSFFVNYNLGQGPWERLPQPLTWNGTDVTYLDGFSQSIETNADNTELYESANIVNSDDSAIDMRVGSIPLTASIYEAENASLTDVSTRTNDDASNGEVAAYINYSDSTVNFNHVYVPSSGTYTVLVRYDNGSGSASSQHVSVNGGTAFTVNYPATYDWNRFQWAQFTCALNSGMNTINFSYTGTYAELDCIEVYKSGINLASDFMAKNRNSGLYLETPSMSTLSGTDLDQWASTDYPCQLWTVKSTGTSGYYTLTNVNSGKLAEVVSSSTSNGALVDQNTSSGNTNQSWQLVPTDSGYYHLINQNSGKYLEVYQNSTSNGASIDQWSDTGYSCQEWTLVKEGMR